MGDVLSGLRFGIQYTGRIVVFRADASTSYGSKIGVMAAMTRSGDRPRLELPACVRHLQSYRAPTSWNAAQYFGDS
jgi:hypothetical protein